MLETAAMVSAKETASNTTNGGTNTVTTLDTLVLITSSTVANSTSIRWSATSTNNVRSPAIAGHPASSLDYSKRLSIRWAYLAPTSLEQVEGDGWLKCAVGQDRTLFFAANTVGQMGFGFSILANGDMVCSVRNSSGTLNSATVTSAVPATRSSSTPANEIWQISDGAENVYTYIDGTLVNTLTGGPTGLSNVATSPFALWAAGFTNDPSVAPTQQAITRVAYPRFFSAR
jgi:hypothetical protein